MIGFRKIEKKESKDFLKHNRIFLQKKTQNWKTYKNKTNLRKRTFKRKNLWQKVQGKFLKINLPLDLWLNLRRKILFSEVQVNQKTQQTGHWACQNFAQKIEKVCWANVNYYKILQHKILQQMNVKYLL